ncbi:hypothetical protein Dxin01_03948 [Deinococcus xinjiangensis]|uniref:Cas12f1-like TNB domain-containing protein n=1 Tax=Deinococcus xinjiangensis TaxID=457454 RepID=A0ABP9VG33_9DEIO
MPLTPEQHNVKLHRNSYKRIEHLISHGTFASTAPANNRTGLPVTATFTLTDHSSITLIHDRQVHIDGVPLNGFFAHLPSPAHAALVAGSSSYTAYPCLDDLLRLARTPTTDPIHLADLLEQCSKQGRATRHIAPMTTLSQQFHAKWLPGQTQLHRTDGNDYYLTLAFDVQFRRLGQDASPCPIGVDVGLNPVAALNYADGRTRVMPCTPLIHVNPAHLSSSAQALLEDITYASGRHDAEQVMRHLVYSATSVTAERLRLGGMNRRYVLSSRDRALQDFHHSWLPQYLWAARIAFQRVPAGHTSTECPHCRHTSPDNRSGGQFHCTSCGYHGDAHLVAASNILRRGGRR